MTLIALQLVARWCSSFGYFGGRGVRRELKRSECIGGVGLIHPVTVSTFVKPPFLPLSFRIPPALHHLCSDLNWQSGLLFLDTFCLSLLFFIISLPLLCSSSSSSCLPLSLPGMGLITLRTNGFIVFFARAIRAQTGGLCLWNLDRISIHRGDGACRDS